MNINHKTIGLSFIEGRVVRDLFENGFLDLMRDQGIEIVLFTPAATVPSFVNQWRNKVKAIEYHPIYSLTIQEQRLLKIRNWVKDTFPFAINFWMRIENRLYRTDGKFETLLKKHNCSTVLLTHPTHSFEMPIYKAARKLNLPVLGILRSWDNIYKGLRLRPDHLTVWNPVNKKETIQVMKLRNEQVHITGGSQFDPYFDKEVINSSRELFCKEFDLDPTKPIITIATLGSFIHAYDEHYLIDHLIECIIENKLPNNCQLIIRLHPTSKLEYMQKYLVHPFVRLSYIDGYIPTIGWNMNLEQVKQVGRLMKHSDVVISPGSTITIETAIFQTPTIVPVFHHYQPESGVTIFNYHFKTHFKRLKEEDLVPFVYQKDDLAPAINNALNNPNEYAEQRKKLAHDYIHFYDGRSTIRIAALISKLIHEA
jgi:UDP-N-acetylglucosamine:LPS N-acetylglucosamine transferase